MILELEPKSLAQSIVQAAGAGAMAVRQAQERFSTPLKVLGIELSSMRRRRGLELEDLAKRANMDANILFAIELGIASYQQVEEHLCTLADALGVNYDEISNTLIQLVLDV